MILIKNNSLIQEKELIKQGLIELKDKRCFYISDRIAYAQFCLLLLTGILTTLIGIFKFSEMFLILFWPLLLLIVPIVSIIIRIVKKEKLSYRYHWSIGISLILTFWISITVYIGVAIDFFHGLWKTLFVCLFLSTYYLIGYLIAKLFRNNRFNYSKRSLLLLFFIGSLISIITTMIIGLTLFFNAVKKYKIKSIYFEDYGNFSSCLSCAFAAFIMISGICVFFSTLFNYLALYNLFQGKKWNIIKNPPNRLIFNYLGITMIFIFIGFICMEFLIPPIMAGGDGGDGGGGGDGGNSGRNSKKVNFNVTEIIQKNENQWKKRNLDSNYIEKINEYKNNRSNGLQTSKKEDIKDFQSIIEKYMNKTPEERKKILDAAIEEEFKKYNQKKVRKIKQNNMEKLTKSIRK